MLISPFQCLFICAYFTPSFFYLSVSWNPYGNFNHTVLSYEIPYANLRMWRFPSCRHGTHPIDRYFHLKFLHIEVRIHRSITSVSKILIVLSPFGKNESFMINDNLSSFCFFNNFFAFWQSLLCFRFLKSSFVLPFLVFSHLKGVGRPPLAGWGPGKQTTYVNVRQRTFYVIDT